ncbi:MAG: hypothetical protein LBH60_01025 [Prevotellaceae bacterium]|jgi:hypothetical protein|nr:hypothetical protein [Prevotellaceae bacterium]
METKDASKKAGKPFIIANPIYDTVFKRLMEDLRIAKFFISTILEQPVEALTVLPQEFTYKLKPAKVAEDNSTEERGEYCFIFRLDFMATVRDSEGNPRKILIELQKSWDTTDVTRFRKYLGEQYSRMDIVDGEAVMLPITTIYILGNNLAGISSPCLKVGRTSIDMINNEPVNKKSAFVEKFTHDSYIIQTGRITDVRYTTNLDKLLSIFEQKYFIVEDSDTRKEYPYQPDDEIMTLITDLLYEMGADPQKRKEMENEKEALRVFNLHHGNLIKTVEEKEKEKTDLKGEITNLRGKLAEMERLLRDRQVE